MFLLFEPSRQVSLLHAKCAPPLPRGACRSGQNPPTWRRFTKGLSVDKISLSTLKGEGELANLELDEIVFTKGLSVDKISLSTLKGEGELANLELDEIVFTKGLSVDKISLSTLKGEGELANLELDEIVLQDVLDLPTWVTIKKATCNKVAIKKENIVFATFPPSSYIFETNKVNDLDQAAVAMVTGAVAGTLWCWVTYVASDRTELEGLVTTWSPP
ncbi:UHRF1-binding protein 1-like [Branchiostoma belcheri]|nr:UHRF1-binding protein 1-like [Branchiostoma belcheri]